MRNVIENILDVVFENKQINKLIPSKKSVLLMK